MAAVATTISQCAAAPLDVASHLLRTGSAPPFGLVGAFSRIIRTGGPLAMFSGLPLHLLKRVPTKALTVALFEVGTQTVLSRRRIVDARSASSSTLLPPHHLAVATLSGAFALLATYPVHLAYYALRKDLRWRAVAIRAFARPAVLYAGVLPALLGTAPAVLVDYVVYRTLRKRIDECVSTTGHTPTMWREASAAALVIGAAASSNLVSGFISEPFKALTRKMAVQAIRSTAPTTAGLRVTAGAMMQAGVGEFWRGFPARCQRYALSAVVSKSTVQLLKSRALPIPANVMSDVSTVMVVSPKRGLPAHPISSNISISPRFRSSQSRS